MKSDLGYQLHAREKWRTFVPKVTLRYFSCTFKATYKYIRVRFSSMNEINVQTEYLKRLLNDMSAIMLCEMKSA
jgi:hypothetical protein